MKKIINKQWLMMGAAFTIGLGGLSGSAHAAAAGGGGGVDFKTVMGNINDSITDIPGMLNGLAYMFGILLGVLGVLKIKDHVENPGNTPLKDGAIRLASGGALLALPFVFAVIRDTVDNGDNSTVTTDNIQKIKFLSN